MLQQMGRKRNRGTDPSLKNGEDHIPEKGRHRPSDIAKDPLKKVQGGHLKIEGGPAPGRESMASQESAQGRDPGTEDGQSLQRRQMAPIPLLMEQMEQEKTSKQMSARRLR